MEKKIIYFKLMQIVLTLAFIWQIVSLRQFCGTFTNPKAFLHDISVGHCKSFTLIGKDSKSGEFGAVFDQDKWHNQMFMSSTNGRPTEEQKLQSMDELAAKLPPAGRHCIPISIWPFNWIRLYKNQLNNGTLFFFSLLFWYALMSLAVLCRGIRDLHLNVEEYEGFWAYYIAFFSVFCWCFCAEHSSTLELNWTDFWTCFNFQADHTNVPFDTLVLSIILACLSIFEIFFKNSLFKKRPVCASTRC